MDATLQKPMLLLLVIIDSVATPMLQLHAIGLVLQLAATPRCMISVATRCNSYVATPCYIIGVATRCKSYATNPRYRICDGIFMLLLNVMILNLVHATRKE
jgi:hypothetical protein